MDSNNLKKVLLMIHDVSRRFFFSKFDVGVSIFSLTGKKDALISDGWVWSPFLKRTTVPKRIIYMWLKRIPRVYSWWFMMSPENFSYPKFGCRGLQILIIGQIRRSDNRRPGMKFPPEPKLLSDSKNLETLQPNFEKNRLWTSAVPVY